MKSQDYFDKNSINILRDSKVIAIDRNQKILLLENQKQLGYEQLIIATGSIVNQLKIACKEDVYYLRTIGDSIRISVPNSITHLSR